MFDRPATGERALLVHLDERCEGGTAGEFRDLAVSAGARIAGTVGYPDRSPDPKFFVGAGKADEVRTAVETCEAEVVLVDQPLSPAQERNLERHVACRVLDRRALILDIFAQRASTFEGKLQVELAQLEHLSTRLVRGWTHLERQKGGIGLRGPGETQLETDRRLVDKRIRVVRERLEHVRVRRRLSRRARSRSGVPVVALVGYTNAGKSTLFNRLTGAGVLAENRLFATLDPTLRRFDLGGGDAVVLADTVGFIRQLPHDLVAAFRATLEETKEAQLLVHVVDATAPDRRERIRDVHDVLCAIGAGEVPRLEVFNKCDELACGGLEAGSGWPRVEHGPGARSARVLASAKTGAGMELVIEAIRSHAGRSRVTHVARIPPSQGRLRAAIHACAHVVEEVGEPDGASSMTFRIEPAAYARLRRDTRLAEFVAGPGEIEAETPLGGGQP
jgi:GTP-binding protein HflX